jgi:hypothetical protein
MSTETRTNPLLTEGRGVVIRDTQGIGDPVLARIVKITEGCALVLTEFLGRAIRFDASTGYAMMAGEHERWLLTAPETQSSDEYDELRTRQARLEDKLVRLRRELEIVTAVLETADDASVEPYVADTGEQQ